jgi:hypothetical protein
MHIIINLTELMKTAYHFDHLKWHLNGSTDRFQHNHISDKLFLLLLSDVKRPKNVKPNDRRPTVWCCHYKRKRWARVSHRHRLLRIWTAYNNRPNPVNRWPHYTPYNRGPNNMPPVAEISVQRLYTTMKSLIINTACDIMS